MTVLTADELAALRGRPHYTKLFLSVYRPTVKFRARVNGTFDNGTMTITYDNVTEGAYTNIVAGMTLVVGAASATTESDKRSGGRVRVRSATNTTISLAENSVNWEDNGWLTVLNVFEPWSVFQRIVYDATTNAATIYKDYDIPYVDQNTVFDPIPMLGPNRAVLASNGTAEVYFDGSPSYDLNNGGVITGYSWEFEGGTPATSAVATPGVVTFAPGHYVVSLTVTNDAGNSYTGYRHVSVYSDPDEVVDDDNPITQWGCQTINGDYQSGGWSSRIWLRGDQYDQSFIGDGAIAIIFAKDTYGSATVGSVPVRTKSVGGNYASSTGDTEALVLCGYIRDGSMKIEPETSVLELEITGLAGRMNTMENFGVSVQNAVTATSWFEISFMRVAYAVYHYLRWNSTIYAIADVRYVDEQHGFQQADFARGNLYAAVNSLLWSTLLARLCCDRQGQLWMEKQMEFVLLASRGAEYILNLERQDWREGLSIVQKREHPVSYVLVGGTAYDGPETNTSTAILSSAPSTTPDYEGASQEINGLVLYDQTVTNQLAGDALAKFNSEFPDVRIPFKGNYRMFDIAPQERIRITLTADENTLGLVWTLKNFIPRAMTLNYRAEQSTLLVDATFVEETDGQPGVAGPYLPTPPDEPIGEITVPAPLTPPGPIVDATGDLVYVATSSDIRRSSNFTAGSPTWSSVLGSITGTIIGFILDPYFPRTIAYCLTTAAVWKTTNLDSVTPTWTSVLTTGSITQAGTSPAMQSISATAGEEGRLYVKAYSLGTFHPTVNNDIKHHVLTTDDRGVTWSERNHVLQSGNTAGLSSALCVGQHDASRVAFIRGEAVFATTKYNVILCQSTNYGVTFSETTIYQNDFSGGYTIFGQNVPARSNYAGVAKMMVMASYTENASDNLYYIAESDGGSGSLYTYPRVFYWNGSALTLKSTVNDLGNYQFSNVNEKSINGFTNVASQVYFLADTGVLYSSDTGATWTTEASGLTGCKCMGIWPYDVQRIFFLESTKIRYSVNGGATLQDKTGDWAGFANPVQIVPVWIA